MKSGMEMDFSTLTYEEWIDFLFDREVTLEPWAEIDAPFEPHSPTRLVEHLTRLCVEFSPLRDRFSWEQINQGVWAVLSNPVETVDYLMSDKIPRGLRTRCIESMYEVFSGTVAKIGYDILMENCFSIWWDLVSQGLCSWCGHWTDEPFIPESDVKREAQEIILKTLLRILDLDDSRCQSSALHGLGHLHHPDVAEKVQHFIDTHREEMTDDGIKWAMECRDGSVM